MPVDQITRFVVEGVAAAAFIGALSWGGVRAALIVMLSARYLALRERRYPESADWTPPHFLGWDPLLLASAVAWPAAFVFVAVRTLGRLPGAAWPEVLLWPAALAWPIVAIALLVRDTRSPWAKLRGTLSRAAAVPEARRDEVLAEGLSVDPQLKAAECGEG
jgi:hypothetical protein